MPDRRNRTAASEALLNRSANHARVISCLAFALALKEGVLDEFINYVGGPVAQSWDSLRGAAALGIAGAIAANLVEQGAQVLSLVGDEHEAEVVLAGWPDEAALAAAGVSQKDAAQLLVWYDAIAEQLGFNFRAHRQVGELTIRIYD